MKENLPQRKNLRIKDYNYSQEGCYFITICTKDRKCILSNVGVDAHIDPKIELTQTGKIVKKYIENFNFKSKNIKVNEYIIMPNHIHMIIELNGSMWASTPTINRIVSTLKILVTKELKHSIWQRNYYEHIIRNENEYLEILDYINQNPHKWLEGDKEP